MITKNFIKMGEKAREIQELWKPKIGDWYLNLDRDVECVSLMGESIIKHHTKYHIWLPTQEQLQEMVLPIFFKRYSTTHALRNDPSFIYRMIIEKFQRWINRSSPSFDKYMAMFNSMNELWLAFVMHEKYHKIWTGEEWKEVVKKIPKQQTLKL